MLVLGVSGAFGHDAAACLIRDGQVVAMMEEERVVRTPHAPAATPLFATLFCLAEAAVGFGDLDCVAASWNPERDLSARHLHDFMNRFLAHDAWHSDRKPPIEYVDHHLAHAASTYYGSGFDEAAVLVVDGNGEDTSTSLGYGLNGSLRLDQTFGVSHSLGQFYTSATRYLGLGSHAEGKTMGLAAYGRSLGPVEPVRLTDDGYRVDLADVDDLAADERFSTLIRAWSQWLESAYGARRPVACSWDRHLGAARRQPSLAPYQADVAASVQEQLTAVIVHLAAVATARYGTRRLAVAGGVGLNCAANGAVAASGLVDDLYIVPAEHDAGGALGAAMWVSAQGGDRVEPLRTPYLGLRVHQRRVADRLREIGVPFTEPSDPVSYAADLLAQGKVIGWVQGRLEVGPRALGNRSILALPDRVTRRDHVNRLKGREPWRPLAPAILDRRAPEFVGDVESPHMLLALSATDSAYQTMPGAVHADGSMRAQVVSSRANPRFHHLLDAVEERTGCPALLNTSFNLSGEAIVANAGDAVRSFLSSGLDALVIEDLVLTKSTRIATGPA